MEQPDVLNVQIGKIATDLTDDSALGGTTSGEIIVGVAISKIEGGNTLSGDNLTSDGIIALVELVDSNKIAHSNDGGSRNIAVSIEKSGITEGSAMSGENIIAKGNLISIVDDNTVTGNNSATIGNIVVDGATLVGGQTLTGDGIQAPDNIVISDGKVVTNSVDG